MRLARPPVCLADCPSVHLSVAWLVELKKNYCTFGLGLGINLSAHTHSQSSFGRGYVGMLLVLLVTMNVIVCQQLLCRSLALWCGLMSGCQLCPNSTCFDLLLICCTQAVGLQCIHNKSKANTANPHLDVSRQSVVLKIFIHQRMVETITN